ncbi:MAG: hypothetical protein GEU93_21295 [Propionibacteriales bacterium]|nr:hypothetical protein [Propionibacteriales bacterium]
MTGGDRLDGARLYRESMTHARRRRASLVSVAAAAAVAAVVVVVSLVDTGGSPTIAPAPPPESVEPSDPSEVKGACPGGEQRAVFPGASVLLGCARLDDGRKVELFSHIQSGGLCLQIVGIDNRARECGNAPSEQEPPVTDAVVAQMIAQWTESAALEVYGAASADVTTVSLTYTRAGSAHRTRAELIRVTDGEALEKAAIGEPFGYFLAELPPETPITTVTAIALDRGQRLGADDFGFLHDQPRRAMISGPIR